MTITAVADLKRALIEGRFDEAIEAAIEWLPLYSDSKKKDISRVRNEHEAKKSVVGMSEEAAELIQPLIHQDNEGKKAFIINRTLIFTCDDLDVQSENAGQALYSGLDITTETGALLRGVELERAVTSYNAAPLEISHVFCTADEDWKPGFLNSSVNISTPGRLDADRPGVVKPLIGILDHAEVIKGFKIKDIDESSISIWPALQDIFGDVEVDNDTASIRIRFNSYPLSHQPAIVQALVMYENRYASTTDLNLTKHFQAIDEIAKSPELNSIRASIRSMVRPSLEEEETPLSSEERTKADFIESVFRSVGALAPNEKIIHDLQSLATASSILSAVESILHSGSLARQNIVNNSECFEVIKRKTYLVLPLYNFVCVVAKHVEAIQKVTCFCHPEQIHAIKIARADEKKFTSEDKGYVRLDFKMWVEYRGNVETTVTVKSAIEAAEKANAFKW